MTTDAPLPPQQLPRSSRWLGWPLLVSLAVNALFIGGLISAVLHHPRGPGRGNGGAPAIGIGAYVSTLPPDRSQAISAHVRELRRAMGPLHHEVTTARDGALAALTAEPFDKERFAAAQTLLVNAEHRQRLAQRDLIAEIAGSMTPDERRTFVTWRGQAHHPHPGRDPSGSPSPSDPAGRPGTGPSSVAKP